MCGRICNEENDGIPTRPVDHSHEESDDADQLVGEVRRLRLLVLRDMPVARDDRRIPGRNGIISAMRRLAAQDVSQLSQLLERDDARDDYASNADPTPTFPSRQSLAPAKPRHQRQQLQQRFPRVFLISVLIEVLEGVFEGVLVAGVSRGNDTLTIDGRFIGSEYDEDVFPAGRRGEGGRGASGRRSRGEPSESKEETTEGKEEGSGGRFIVEGVKLSQETERVAKEGEGNRGDAEDGREERSEGGDGGRTPWV